MPTPDGGTIVFGSTPWTLDLGDRTLPVTHSPASFVAELDAAGATRWAFAPDAVWITNIALTAQGTLLIASRSRSGMYESDADAYLSVATPDGLARTLRISGSGDQRIDGLATTPEGHAWVQVSNLFSDDNEPAPVMQIGDHTFTEVGTYLFKLVP